MAASKAAACSSATGTSPGANAQLAWLRESEQEAQHDDLSQLLSETKGVVEKLADPAVKLGSWQVVLWQPRMIFADADGLSYQKIDPNEAPIGKAKRIEFASITEIEELDCAEFVLLSGRREYTFKAPSEDACTVLVHNLRQLCERQRAAAAAAGDAAPAPRRGLSKLFSRGSHARSSVHGSAAAGAPAESSAS